MSRQPTWDTALRLQAEMFEEAAKVGGLDVQLAYYRGFDECRASRWVSERAALARPDDRPSTAAAATPRSARILAHARKETGKRKVNVLVFVGDAMEEKIDDLAATAGELGLLGLRVFIFQEGRDPTVERGLPRDRAALRRRLCAFRRQCRRTACRAAARRGGLCRRRPEGARQRAAPAPSCSSSRCGRPMAYLVAGRHRCSPS